jgi:hypothetical protein
MAVGCNTKFNWCVGEKAKPLLRPDWAPSEPSGATGKDCVAVTASSSSVQIVSKDCTEKIRFICEVQIFKKLNTLLMEGILLQMRDTRNKSLASAALINECAMTYSLTEGSFLTAILVMWTKKNVCQW